MMKASLVLIMVLLVVGCSKLEEKAVGMYELSGRSAAKINLRKGGAAELWGGDGTRKVEATWVIKNGEIYILDPSGGEVFLKLNDDGDLEVVATIIGSSKVRITPSKPMVWKRVK